MISAPASPWPTPSRFGHELRVAHAVLRDEREGFAAPRELDVEPQPVDARVLLDEPLVAQMARALRRDHEPRRGVSARLQRLHLLVDGAAEARARLPLASCAQRRGLDRCLE